MLARLRMEHSAIRDGVLKVDDRKMTIDRLKLLKSFAPTAQEVCYSNLEAFYRVADGILGHPSE